MLAALVILAAIALVVVFAVRALRRAEADGERPFTGAPYTPDEPTKRRPDDPRAE